MKEFPNYLMRNRGQYERNHSQRLQGIELSEPLHAEQQSLHELQGMALTENLHTGYENMKIHTVEQAVERYEKKGVHTFRPTILPNLRSAKVEKGIDYLAVKEQLTISLADLLLFTDEVENDEQVVLVDNLDKKVYRSHALKTPKRILKRSIDGILEQELAPNQYFSETMQKER